jgi:hypothetical protein
MVAGAIFRAGSHNDPGSAVGHTSRVQVKEILTGVQIMIGQGAARKTVAHLLIQLYKKMGHFYLLGAGAGP